MTDRVAVKSISKKRCADDSTLSVEPLRKVQSPTDRAPPTYEAACAKIGEFHRSASSSFSAMYDYLRRCAAYDVEFSTDTAVVFDETSSARRVAALVCMLRWSNYDAFAAQIAEALPAWARVFYTDQRRVAFWGIVFASPPEADAVWLSVCRERRGTLEGAPFSALREPPATFSRMALCKNDRADLSAFVARMCDASLGKQSADATLRGTIAVWLSAFAAQLDDASGKIALYAVANGDERTVEAVGRTRGFTQYAVSRTLETLVSRLETSAQPKDDVEWRLVATSVDVAIASESSGDFYGLSYYLFMVAMLVGAKELMTKIATLSRRLGPIDNVPLLVAKSASIDDSTYFCAFVSLELIDSHALWVAFVATTKGTTRSDIEKLRAFLVNRKQWALDNHRLIRSTLERRALIQMVCEFNKFIATYATSVDPNTLALATFNTVRKYAAKTKADSNDTALCLGCGETADYLLLCGHLIGCEKCIDKIVDVGGHSACPKCRVAVNKATANWKIKLYK